MLKIYIKNAKIQCQRIVIAFCISWKFLIWFKYYWLCYENQRKDSQLGFYTSNKQRALFYAFAKIFEYLKFEKQSFQSHNPRKKAKIYD
jgi:hypothetical protein